MASGRGTVGNLLVNMRVELGQLRTDVKEIEKTFNTGFASIKSSAASFGRDLAGSLGVGLSVGAVVAFGKSILDLASKLSDLRTQTGISGQTLSGIKSTLEESGTSVDAFANGIFKLQKELGTITKDTDPAAQAIKQLGLNLDQLRNTNTEKFLELITDAFGKQTNVVNRNALAFQLMGRSARELIPGLLEISGKVADLRKQGMSDADITALDRFGDSLTRLGNAARITAAGPLTDLVKVFERLFNITQEGRLTNSMTMLAEEVERIETMLARRQSLREKGLGFFTAPAADDKAQLDRLKELKERLADVGGELGRLRAGSQLGKPAPFIAPVDTKSIDQAKNATDSFIEGLQKQYDALKISEAGMYGDSIAAKRLALDLEFAAFKQKLFNDGLKLPPGAEERFNTLKASIMGVTVVIEDQKNWIDQIQAVSKAWLNTIDETADAEQKFSDLKIDLEQYDDLGRTLTDISKKYMKLIADAAEWARVAGAAPEEIETATRRLLINRAIEQVRARVAASGEDIDPNEEGRRRAEQLGEDIGGSITSGIRNTLMGIETGQQSVSEGLKNMLRNIGLELQFLMFDETVLKPIKAFAKGFVTGLFDSISGAFEEDMQEWGKELGKMLKQLLDSIFQESGGGSWIAKGFGIFASLFGLGAAAFGGGGGGGSLSGDTFEPTGGGGLGGDIFRARAAAGGLIQAFAKGGPVLSFASGGAVPILAHSGEFVMNRRAVSNVGASVMSRINDSGRLPQSNTVVNINGSIIPNDPNARREEIIQVMVADADNNGAHFRTLHQRSSILSKG